MLIPALIRKPVVLPLPPKPFFLRGRKQSSQSEAIFGQSGGLQTPPEDSAFPSQDPSSSAKTRGESFQQKFVFMEILFPSRRLSHHRFLFVGACIQKSPDTQPLTPWPLRITRLYLSSQAHRLLIPPLKRPFELLCRGGLPRVGKSLNGVRPCTSGLGEDRQGPWKGWGRRTLSSEVMEGEPGHTPMSLHPALCSLIVGDTN